MFPPEKREYELVYHGKEREEDILANTLAVPLQPVRAFGKNGDGLSACNAQAGRQNMLILGDDLQVPNISMKQCLQIVLDRYFVSDLHRGDADRG